MTDRLRDSGKADPFLLEEIRCAFDAIADQMALTLLRRACSHLIRDSMDFSTAVCDAAGRMLAQGNTNPVHLASFFDAMAALVEQARHDMEPGDVFIFNDPYACAGQHLPDVYVVRPVFHGGIVVAFAATVSHQHDFGGMMPGSNTIGPREIFQEGLRLPILKFVARGKPNAAVWDIIRLNVRVPDIVLRDLQSQLAATALGERELAVLVRRHGASTLAAYAEHLHDYAERLVRGEIADIPDGVYRFVDHIEGFDGTKEAVTLKVALTVEGEFVTVDWSGSSPQVEGSINAVLTYTKSCVYAALRSIFAEDLPNCQGYSRAIRIVAPAGTVVNAVAPAPCGARRITGYRLIDCLFGALAAAVPHRVPADSCGGATLITLRGREGRGPFVLRDSIMGNGGATSEHDGQDGIGHLGADLGDASVEAIERQYPVRIERCALVPDSGGCGRFRGGLSVVRDYRLLAESAALTVRSDKRLYPPHGLFGGLPGRPSLNVINPERDEILLPVLPTAAHRLKRGDLFRHVLAGGGGYGNPLERDLAAVLRDVIDGRLSAGSAASDYGVAVRLDKGPRVDAAATAALRAKKRRRRAGPGTRGYRQA